MSTMDNTHSMVPAKEQPMLHQAAEQMPPDQPGFTMTDVWRILRQRKLLIIISFCVFYAMVGGATFAVWRWFPTYRSEAVLELHPPVTDALSPVENLIQPQVMEMMLATEAQKIERLDVLQEVLKLPEIQATSFYKWYEGDSERALYDLQSYLNVAPIRQTHLINVSLAIRDPEEARLIVDTVVKRYVDRFQRDSESDTQRRYEELKSTRDAVESELADKQRELSDFRARSDVGSLETEAITLSRQIADQTYVVNQYDARTADLKAQLDAIEGIDPRSLPISPEDRVIVESDPTLRLYRNQVESLEVQIDTLATLVGEKNRQLRIMRKSRDGYYEKEVARREELLNDLRERKVDNLRQELARVRSVQVRMQDQLDDMVNRQVEFDKVRVKYDTMVAEEERLQRSLERLDESVMERKHMAEATKHGQAADLTIEQVPKKAVEPSRPDWKIWLGGGFFLALAGAIGLAFLREFTDKAVRTPIDVARYGRLSVLGSVPELDDEHVDLDEIEYATRRAPHSLIAEAFRQVRANLVFSGRAESQHCLLITSPSAGNGKTSIAINLAVALAQSNQRVLLIDCNFRQPAIRTAFPNTRPEGLSNVLIGQKTLRDVITPADAPNLDVMTSGPMPPTPAELLGSSYMRDLIDEAKQQYDRVILDGPPVLLVSDALVVSTLMDGVILVARAASNSKGVLRRAREQLDKVNAHVIGAVLNGVEARPGGYFRQQYDEFYEYAGEETIPPELPGVASAKPDAEEDLFAEDDEERT